MLIVWLICTFGLITTSTTTPVNSTQAAFTATTFTVDLDPSDGILDLDNAESNDKKKLEIIKQIRRVNSDGSYTVGYEAVDGRFKIESRDVLGNVKGTYGYVDLNGEIKRVSYTANNNTNDMKSTPQPIEEVVHIPRLNKSGFAVPTTRRPSSLSYLMTSTSSPAQMNANIMQAIPKRRILMASSASSNKQPYAFKKPEAFGLHSDQTTPKSESSPTVIYATSIRSTVQPSTTTNGAADEHISKTNNFNLNESLHKTTIVTSKDTKSSAAQSEKNSSQTERKSVRGNSLRRQLPSDQTENFETHQQIVHSQGSDEESTHTYSGITGTQRPIFTTTSSPRIPALVLAARSRAAQLKNAALHSTQTPTTTERTYTKQPRRNSERREQNNEPKIDPITDHEYLTQGPEAVQIPSSRDNQPNNEIQSHSHRHPNEYLPRTRDFFRQPSTISPDNNDSPVQYKFPTQVQQTFTQNQENKQFLRETTDPNLKVSTTTISPDQYTNSDVNAATQPILQSFHPRGPQPFHDPRQTARNEHEQHLQQQQSIPLPFQPYQSPYNGPIPPQIYNYPERPVTARDFERLLSLLVLRHQQQQRLNLLPGLMNSNFYNGGIGGFGGFFGGYNPYSPFNYQPNARSPLYNQFDPRYTAFSRSLPPVPPPNSFHGPYSEQENMYQAQNPVEQQLPYMRRSMQPRRKFNNNNNINSISNNNNNNNNQYYATNYEQPDYGDSSQKELRESYLPPEVREELLYRMLMLAIQPDVGHSLAVPDASTMQEYYRSHSIPAIMPTLLPNSKKPVRSVQILGEE